MYYPIVAVTGDSPRAVYARSGRLATELSTRIGFLLPVLAEAG